METAVVIVGAGPSGIATSACLNLRNIPNVVLEREDCCASLWKKRAYDCLNLHLAKQFCQLPHMPHPSTTPTFISKRDFIRYIDDYVTHFNVNPVYWRSVQSATFDATSGIWRIAARDTISDGMEEYMARFLVVATGENAEGFIPDVPGLETFPGPFLHSGQFKSGKDYTGKSVLVVGCGNSGMEIAYDLSNHGAITSIVVRNPFHIVTKEMVQLGMVLLKFLPLPLVDFLTIIYSNWKFGDLSKYGIHKPKEGPFLLKSAAGQSPVLDVGTVRKIKTGEIQSTFFSAVVAFNWGIVLQELNTRHGVRLLPIVTNLCGLTKSPEATREHIMRTILQVLPCLKGLTGSEATCTNGTVHHFDAIIFATGYRSTAKRWLKDEGDLLNENGFPRSGFPNHWKGKNGLYCAGLSRMGLAGVSADAQLIAENICKAYTADAVDD